MAGVISCDRQELEVSRLEKEVEALRVAAPLLSEDEEAGNDHKPRLATSTANATLRKLTALGGTTAGLAVEPH
jgi:hypothetical protein